MRLERTFPVLHALPDRDIATDLSALFEIAAIPYPPGQPRLVFLVRGGGHRVQPEGHDHAIYIDTLRLNPTADRKGRVLQTLAILAERLNSRETGEALVQAGLAERLSDGSYHTTLNISDERMNRSDALAYEMHRLVVKHIDENPDAVIALARRNVQKDEDHPHYREWKRILDLGPKHIKQVLSEKTERSQVLRASSPFAGTLTEDERRLALTRFHAGISR